MKGPYVFTIIFVYHSILRPPKAEGRFCTYLAEIKRYLARRRLAQSARLARLLTCMSVFFSLLLLFLQLCRFGHCAGRWRRSHARSRTRSDPIGWRFAANWFQPFRAIGLRRLLKR